MLTRCRLTRFQKIYARAFPGLLLLAVAFLSGGCATFQRVDVLLEQTELSLRTAAFVPQEGNSPSMDDAIQFALLSHGIAIKAPLPAGTRKADDVDIIVTYVDVWRWDISMYLKSLDIRFYDARTGTLMVSGHWENSALHGFQGYREVTKGLVDEMFMKIKNIRKTN